MTKNIRRVSFSAQKVKDPNKYLNIFLDTENYTELVTTELKSVGIEHKTDSTFAIGAFVTENLNHGIFRTVKEMQDFIENPYKILGDEGYRVEKDKSKSKGIRRRPKNIVFWFHNARYDLKLLLKDEWIINRSESRFICCNILKNKHYHIEIKDSSNFFVGYKLDELGQIFNPKFVSDEHQLFDLHKRVLNDCYNGIFTVKFLIEMCKKYNVNLPYTAAGLSYQIFKSNYHNGMYLELDDSEEILDIIHKSYAGGRTENFVFGEINGEITSYDVNSLYPYCMYTYNFPNPSTRYMMKVSDYAKIFNPNQFGFIHCIISCDENCFYPVLSVLDKNNKRIYPVGEFEGVWTLHELRYALSTGFYRLKGKNIINVVGYTESLPFFRQFVHDFYPLKQFAETKPERAFAKLVLNSCYGKTAQKDEVDGDNKKVTNEITYINIDNYNEDDYEQINYGAFDDDNNFMILCKNKNKNTHKIDSFYALPEIASYVTSYARIYLNEHIYKALKRGYVTIYCDTDSLYLLHVNNDYDKPFENIDSKKLGFWDLEKSTKKMRIYACKHYEYADNDGNMLIGGLKGIGKIERRLISDDGKKCIYEFVRPNINWDSYSIDNPKVEWIKVRKEINYYENQKRVLKKEDNLFTYPIIL